MIEWSGEILAKQGYGVLARQFLSPILDKIKVSPEEDYVKPENKIEDSRFIKAIIQSKIKPATTTRIHFKLPNLYKVDPEVINIGSCLWDTNMFHPEWVKHMNKMDGLLFPTSGMMTAALKSGVNIPCGFFNHYLDLSMCSGEGDKLSLSGTENKVVFLLDGSWSITNDIERLIAAFSIAFSNIQNVVLVLKLSTEQDVNKKKIILAGVQEFINKLIEPRNRPNIIVFTDELSPEKSLELYRGAHYYCNISRASTIDVNLATARACGLPVIGTEIPNREDLIDFKVSHHREPIMGIRAPFYNSYQMWSVANTEELMNKMLEAYRLVMIGAEYKKLRASCEKKTKEKYSSTNLLEAIEDLQEKIEAEKSVPHIS